MNKKMAREIVESLPSLYPLMTADEEEAIWTVLATNSNTENDSDCISRQQAIDALNEVVKDHSITDFDAIASILDLPPAQPEIIRCRNCKFASGDSRICMKFGHSPIGELDFCAWAERRTDGIDQKTAGD